MLSLLETESFETGPFETGLPQDEQKRTPTDNSLPQARHFAMTIFPLQSTADEARVELRARRKSWSPRRLVRGNLESCRTSPFWRERIRPEPVVRCVLRADEASAATRSLFCYHPKAMTSRMSRWLRDPLFLLCLAAGLLAFVVQSGELGSADTMHRLQTTHWLWTSQPQVFPNEYPEFGLHGRGGQIFSWYGIGQSLLMLPADVVASWVATWHIFSAYQDDPAVRSILVSYSTNILLSVLTAWIAFRLLSQLRFGLKESIAGVLALLFCTTHLHYTQNMMENNYIMLLTLAGFSFQYQWLRTGSRRALLIGSGALGLNLLTRVTTGLDLIAGGVFLLLVLWFERVRGRALWERVISYNKIALPIYAVFAILERLYNFYRFGSLTQTYLPIFARELRAQDPTLPTNFPWSTPFHAGVLGALFKPEKSIFLFDPLLVLALILLALLWKRLGTELRAYSLTALLLLAGYIGFYARYTYWAGDFAWGDRYVSTAVEMVALIAVPLLVRHRANLNRWVWRGGVTLVAVSLIVQIASLAFWLPLEIYQMDTFGHPTFVVALRFKNIAAFALGKMQLWGLNTDDMGYDPWDYVHITTWNFLPFLLRRVGATPRWVVNTAFGLWIAATAALGATLWRIRRLLRSSPMN